MTKQYSWKITKVIDPIELSEVKEIEDGIIDRIYGYDWDNTDPGVRFRMYDDDGEHYYSGRLQVDPEEEYLEDALSHMLAWGATFAGVTDIRFPSKPEWDAG